MHRRKSLLVLSLGILNALTPFTIDLYLPAFPQIASDLHTPATRMSLSVSVYFIGFALGQILYGPLLDRFGRKPPIYFGLLLYLASSFGCMNAHSFEALLLFRFLSAIGGSAASVGTIAMVRDFFPAEEGGKIFSMLMLVLSVSPLLAPTLGSFMISAWGWRAIFGALAAFALFDVLLVTLLPKSYEADPTVNLKPWPILHTFREILRVPEFRIYTFAGSLSFAGLFVFVAGSPTLFMNYFGVNAKQFGGIFAILAGGMVAGGQLNHLFLKYTNGKRVFQYGLTAQMILGLVFLIGTFVSSWGLYATVAVLLPILVCAGITYPNAAALALAPFDRNIGSASSLLGFLQLGLGSVAAALVGLLDIPGTLPMATVIAVCSAAGWILVRRPLDGSKEV